jgi:hypothetical protein
MPPPAHSLVANPQLGCAKSQGTAVPLHPGKIIAGESCDRASHNESVAYGWKILLSIRRPTRCSSSQRDVKRAATDAA